MGLIMDKDLEDVETRELDEPFYRFGWTKEELDEAEVRRYWREYEGEGGAF